MAALRFSMGGFGVYESGIIHIDTREILHRRLYPESKYIRQRRPARWIAVYSKDRTKMIYKKWGWQLLVRTIERVEQAAEHRGVK